MWSIRTHFRILIFIFIIILLSGLFLVNDKARADWECYVDEDGNTQCDYVDNNYYGCFSTYGCLLTDQRGYYCFGQTCYHTDKLYYADPTCNNACTFVQHYSCHKVYGGTQCGGDDKGPYTDSSCNNTCSYHYVTPPPFVAPAPAPAPAGTSGCTSAGPANLTVYGSGGVSFYAKGVTTKPGKDFVQFTMYGNDGSAYYNTGMHNDGGGTWSFYADPADYRTYIVKFWPSFNECYSTNFYRVAPTPTPTPTVSITCSPGSIPYGGSANVSWSSTNAKSCSVSPAGWTGTSGSQSTGALFSSQTYSVTCMGF